MQSRFPFPKITLVFDFCIFTFQGKIITKGNFWKMARWLYLISIIIFTSCCILKKHIGLSHDVIKKEVRKGEQRWWYKYHLQLWKDASVGIVIYSKTGSETTKLGTVKYLLLFTVLLLQHTLSYRENFLSVKKLSKNKVINIKEIKR